MAEQDKNPIVMILGDKEVDTGIVNLRHKVKQKRYQQELQEFKYALIQEMQTNI